MIDEKLEQLYNFDLWAESLEHVASKNKNNLGVLSELDMLSNRTVILSLIDSIKQGTYKIGTPTVIKKKKDNGKYRELYVNSIQDRVILRVINKIYFNMYGSRVHNLCVSYREGTSIGEVVSSISKKLSKGHITGYKVDISKFFDSVDRKSLLNALNFLSSDSVVDRLILDYYTDDRVFLKDEQMYVERYKGLAQGCALSSFLCDYILRDIDEYFSGSEIYYRYSDDIIIFDEDDSILEKLDSKLNEYGLSLNLDKVERISSNNWFTFLGFSIKGDKISISKKSLQKFQSEIKTRYMNCKSYRGFKRSVYSYLYSSDVYSCRGWFGIKVGTVNCIPDIKYLDNWVQDMFLAFKYKHDRIGSLGYNKQDNGVISRGKGRHVKRNREKGTDEEFVSMLNLYYMYKMDRNLYLNELIVRGVI